MEQQQTHTPGRCTKCGGSLPITHLTDRTGECSCPRSATVRIGRRLYTVNYTDDNSVASVLVHALSTPGGYCVAFRRIPIDGPKARAAIARATGEQS